MGAGMKRRELAPLTSHEMMKWFGMVLMLNDRKSLTKAYGAES